MLAGSIIFYASGEPVYVFLLIGMTLLNHISGWLIWQEGRRSRKLCFVLIIVVNVSVLALWKLLQLSGQISVLPLGISFYLFKMISYQADLYRGRIEKKPVFYRTALYFTLFTQVTSGPVMKYQEGGFSGEKEYSRKKIVRNLEEGLQYFIIGLSMKVLLADRLAILWNDILTIGFISISTPLAWLGLIGYALQLYFDFWGYSLMASGLGVMLGYDFILNFNHPYSAHSISEFYRRWHVTLGRWFRDYVYIPLGGNRVSGRRLLLNLLLVWLLTGIWHGNGINYLLWGLSLGLFIILEKVWLGQYLNKWRPAGRIYTILVILLTWAVFAIPDIQQLGVFFSRLFPFFTPVHETVNHKDILNYLQTYWKLLAVGILLCVPGVYGWYEKHKKNMLVIAGLLILFWYGIYCLVNAGSNPFLYFSY